MAKDLEKMSRAELEDLGSKVEKQLKKLALTERKDALKAARLAAQEHGFDLEELLSGDASAKKGKSSAKNPPKYRNPENTDQTWSGRGRKPQWIIAAQDAGVDIADFAI